MRTARCMGIAASSVIGALGLGLAIGAEPEGGPGGPGQPRPDMRERRGRIFDELDTNHDGQISREEFSARRPPRPDGPRGEGEGRPPGGRGFGGPATRPEGGPGGPGARGPLAGPRPEGPGPGEGGEMEPPPRPNRRGGPMFGMLDTNHDGRLQTAEIQRVVDIFKKAMDASKEEDLSPEDWMDLVGELRPGGPGRPPRPQDGAEGGRQKPPPPPK